MEGANSPIDSPSKKSRLAEFFGNSRDKEEGIVLEWSNVEYSVLEKDPVKSKLFQPVYKMKNILKGASGNAKSGQLLAIMGATGNE